MCEREDRKESDKERKIEREGEARVRGESEIFLFQSAFVMSSQCVVLQ